MARGVEHRRVLIGRSIDVAAALYGLSAVLLVTGSIALWHYVGVPIHDLHIYELAGARAATGGQVYELRPTDSFPAGELRALPLFGPPAVVLPWQCSLGKY